MANPEVMPLKLAEIHSIVDMFQASGGIVEGIDWLSENTACDIRFAVIGIDEADRILANLLIDLPYDYYVQLNENRRKKLLISDMDSTIINQECLDELADYIGIKDKIAAITERAMNGEIDFKDALRERITMLKDLPEKALQETYDNKITLMSGARELVNTMKANGARTVLVSGGFTFFTERVANSVGFAFNEANILEIENSKLTGRAREPILNSVAKLNALHFHADELCINLRDTIAVGDGANDLPMLKEAGIGVAYRAKPKVRAETSARIDTTDLKSLLYLQGYSDKEILI
jgi:phosphoserine phosphatase